MITFLKKPRVNKIAAKFIQSIEKDNEDYQITFKNHSGKLFWPGIFSIDRLDQVVAETFDQTDWHFYQKQHTEVSQGEIILDIGTAEGLMPLTVIDKCQHIFMIEPSASFVKTLSKTFQNYPKKTTIYNYAVGNEDGVISFDENSLEGMISNEATPQTNSVEIHKIDSIFSDNQKITYLKADIEGFEEEMLRGAENTIKRNKPKIAITTYHTQNNPKEIIDIITGFVPEYKYYVKGIYEETPKPVLIHFWI
ncbi:FkbM family methyltransferase [Flavobacterium sp. NST-5]|uniref:FkbM family methyltransferase n=1 Tax=Flavobacterium ichthyis TaxID=2698827 RepID=A0ABW9ZAR4_9FLAO|nr:FkbM family methyltransferase [Flavobacterium ichthyis]NBL65784.1 FkbM family methyltransferase [Flavobacterium ichthyis]